MNRRWPPEIPSRFYRSGASLPYADGRRRSEAAEGPGQLRLRTSTVVRPVAGMIDMSAAEHARLERFWDEDTAGGVLPFWFPHAYRHGMPLISGSPPLHLLTAAGRPLLISAWWLCQFGQRPPEPQPMAGGRFRVAVSLSVLP